MPKKTKAKKKKKAATKARKIKPGLIQGLIDGLIKNSGHSRFYWAEACGLRPSSLYRALDGGGSGGGMSTTMAEKILRAMAKELDLKTVTLKIR